MGLKNKDLSVALLNKLSALEELDLSGNMLQKLPDGLSLPCMRLLNFSNNDMEDVTSLKVLSGLEELRLDDNLYLTVRTILLICTLLLLFVCDFCFLIWNYFLFLQVSDEHKVMFLLPKLKILNGKDIGSTANHIRYVNSEILRKRVSFELSFFCNKEIYFFLYTVLKVAFWLQVAVVWEKNFSLPDPATSQSLNDLEKKFVNAACFQVKYGPSSLNDYTKWRVRA